MYVGVPDENLSTNSKSVAGVTQPEPGRGRLEQLLDIPPVIQVWHHKQAMKPGGGLAGIACTIELMLAGESRDPLGQSHMAHMAHFALRPLISSLF